MHFAISFRIAESILMHFRILCRIANCLFHNLEIWYPIIEKTLRCSRGPGDSSMSAAMELGRCSTETDCIITCFRRHERARRIIFPKFARSLTPTYCRRLHCHHKKAHAFAATLPGTNPRSAPLPGTNPRTTHSGELSLIWKPTWH
jgi:hypothetical protein